jgi:hypothetical protein
MGYVKWSSAAWSILLIAGCSAPEPPPPTKTVFDPLTRQIDKAREVQQTVDENAARTRKEIDKQERGDDPAK